MLIKPSTIKTLPLIAGISLAILELSAVLAVNWTVADAVAGSERTLAAKPRQKKAKRPAFFPRRALLISVSNYLFANRVNYGHKRVGTAFPGSSTTALRDQLLRSPMNFPGSQVFEITDAAKIPIAPSKAVIKKAVCDFLTTSRKQDRIILLFAGHAVEHDNNVYLVPIEGDLQDPTTLISMNWLFGQLGKCNAQQKVLLLDVCRYPVGHGFLLPPRDPLGEAISKAVKNPPPGVQVWVVCQPKQYSLEFESGSLFIEALCGAMQNRGFRQGRIHVHADPIPVEQLHPIANKYMAKLWPSKKDRELQQRSELFGKTPKTRIYDKKEPLPKSIAIKSPVPAAAKTVADDIIEEMKMIPSARAGTRRKQSLLSFIHLLRFDAKVMQIYNRDYNSIKELKKQIEKAPDKYGLRRNVLKVIDILHENVRFTVKGKLYGNGPVGAAVKQAFKKEQEKPGIAIFFLKSKALPLLDEVKNKYLEKEPSRRWKAMYHFTRARVLSRLIFLFEYSYTLGKVQSGLPKLTPGMHTGWVIGSERRVNVGKIEPNVRSWDRELRKIWRHIQTEYAGTPWAMFAKREANIARGLEWRPSRN